MKDNAFIFSGDSFNPAYLFLSAIFFSKTFIVRNSFWVDVSSNYGVSEPVFAWDFTSSN
jgi:hypothetical protein